MNNTVPTQAPIMTKVVFTFPYEAPYLTTYRCKKMIFEGLKIDGEVVICDDYWGCFTPSIQRLREEFWKCNEEASKPWYEKLELQRKLEGVVFGWKKMKEKINELNRLYEEKKKDCDALSKELDKRFNKLNSELRRIFHEKLFEMTIKPYLMAISATDEEINKVRDVWLNTVELAVRYHTSMAFPIPKGFCRVSMTTETYGTTPPYVGTSETYIVEIFTSYDFCELGAFIGTLKQQHRDLINAGCFSISSDIEIERMNT